MGIDVVVRDGDMIDERQRMYYTYKQRRERAESGMATRLELIVARIRRVRGFGRS